LGLDPLNARVVKKEAKQTKMSDKNNQDFIFKRARKTTKEYQKLEVQILKFLVVELQINATNLQQFKRLARLNKKRFLIKTRKLLIRHNKKFARTLTFEINKMLHEGLKQTDKLVKGVAKASGGAFKPPPVIKVDKLLMKASKVVKKYETIIVNDVKLSNSPTLQMLSRKYSHIVKEIANNVKDLQNQKAFVSELWQQSIKSLNKIADQGLPGYIQTPKRRWNPTSYVEMTTRANYKNAFLEMQDLRFKSYGLKKVMSNVLADCSTICAPFQGGVFSVGAAAPGLETKESAELQGHTTHLYCRHYWMPFVDGASTVPDPIDPKLIARNRAARIKQRYNERQIRKWKKRQVIADTKMHRMKIKRWQKTQRQLINANPELAREYNREQIV
jgi:hypothetical protein